MLKITVNEKFEHEIMLEDDKVLVNGEAIKPDLVKISPTAYHLLLNGRSYNLNIVEQPDEKHLIISVNGNRYKINIKDRYDLLLHDLGMDDVLSAKAEDLKAPMPGLVVDVLVKENEEVEKGAPLLILEAMKMENVLKADNKGIVQQVLVKQKDTVEKNQVLIRFQ